MAATSVEFPVGGLLNGDSYKTSTRMKNISSAMTWIQKQLKSMRESDQQLIDLFQRLETDVSDLKSLYVEGTTSRGRNSSVSSIRDYYSKTSLTTAYPLESATLPPSSTSKVSILDSEAAAILEHSDSNDSLTNFADELGFDDDEDALSEDRPSIKSQSSNDQPATGSHTNIEDESSLDFSPRDSERISVKEEKVMLRRLSNDSGAVADSDSTGSNVMPEGKKLGVSLTADDEKRLSGFADEIFKMFQLSNS
ncbi:PREDICTED: uncharacterized protein LOC100631400 [Amphimedon queenslandica]|uniref:Uncharacterized protein n=1 Tax=Amphimedon queenslandica TaxID=400682 RepID=A0A1X7V1S4_AMPQE|nr:PREDICTED: uncharacterized protein LOC100631400 [Amphimedon queenslandica]|eukprot:XP_003385983.1 PREDICTED: uncharacterized protein LOC100631400 [Amphimedon queenslandica]